MRFLAIDFGLKKIGLAISEGDLAEPLAVIPNQSSVISKMVALCRERKIEEIIVGVAEGKIAKQARSFGEALSRKSGLVVVYQDETLTTKEAIGKMVEVGKKRKYRQEKEDAFAAALILQEYLDKQKRRKLV